MKKSLLLVSLLALSGLASCASTPDVNDDEQNGDTTTETEVENYKDEVLKENMEGLITGFSMHGNITQERYE